MKARAVPLAFLIILWVTVVAAWGWAKDINFQLGFGGQIVADSWNPLQITMRDQPPAELVMTIDQGNLRVGERIVRYEAKLTGGTGLFIFTDDVYIPAWHSFTWKIRTPSAVLASGSFDRRTVDTRPVDLVVSRTPDSHHELFAKDARLAYPASTDLPTRAAAYSGVRTLLVDGSTAPPALEAVAAATAAGVNTVLLGPLPPSYQGLAQLTPTTSHTTSQRLGAGWISRMFAGQTLPKMNSLDRPALLAALNTSLIQKPRSAPQLLIAAAVAVYLLASLLLIRFAGAPGLFAAFSLGLLLGLGAWSALRPNSASLSQTHSLSLEAGGLADVLRLRGVFSLPARTLTLPVAHPLDAELWTQKPESLSLHLARWSGVSLALRPTLRTATFRWRGGVLENGGEQRLFGVYVSGLGAQGTLSPGARLHPRQQDDTIAPARYAALLDHLPVGSALAYREQAEGEDDEDEEIFVALPEVSTSP
jgi:hypothetical protein